MATEEFVSCVNAKLRDRQIVLVIATASIVEQEGPSPERAIPS